MMARYSSSTMILTAIQRAAHQVLDDEPRILDDPMAVGLTEVCSRKEILAAANGFSGFRAKSADLTSVLLMNFFRERASI